MLVRCERMIWDIVCQKLKHVGSMWANDLRRNIQKWEAGSRITSQNRFPYEDLMSQNVLPEWPRKLKQIGHEIETTWSRKGTPKQPKLQHSESIDSLCFCCYTNAYIQQGLPTPNLRPRSKVMTSGVTGKSWDVKTASCLKTCSHEEDLCLKLGCRNERQKFSSLTKIETCGLGVSEWFET